MQVQNQANNSVEHFIDVFAKALEGLYKQQLSEAIKKGIRAKKLQKEI